MVIKGIAEIKKNIGNKIIISAVEHSSIVAPCNYLASHGYDVSVIPLTKEGIVDLNILEQEIDDKTILVSICSVDSELGTIQPINEIAKIISKYPNVTFHTDATQAIGKVELDYDGVDFTTFAPHKFFGLNGFGVLVNANNAKLVPLIHGGKSTTIYRSGTPVTANVIALGKALELATNCVHINSPENAIPNTLNISLINKDTKSVLKELENNHIYLSTTTACALGTSPSKSVLAITNDEHLAANTLRISISHLDTEDEINEFLKVFNKIIVKK